MTITSTLSDTDLKTAVVAELDWTPGVDPTHIGVGVTDGAVTLSGEVESYPEKLLAEKAVQRVRGVHGVAQEMTVHSRYGAVNDTDIAREAGHALAAAVDIAPDCVTATVQDGVVTLVGTVPWNYQREAAHRIVRYLKGVHDVRNHVTVKPHVSTVGIKRGIEDALVRSARLDAGACTVTSDGLGVVTIEGTVDTWAERHDIDRLAWAAPGVTSVRNRLHLKG